MTNPISARYRARDGTDHLVLVQRTPEGRWQVLDRADGSERWARTVAIAGGRRTVTLAPVDRAG
jgi:hypothetical protein